MKIYVIRLEEINQYVGTAGHRQAGRLVNYLIRKERGLPPVRGNETTVKMLESLLTIRKYCKIKRLAIFTLWNLGWRASQIARITGLSKSNVYYHINAALCSKDMKNDFMILADAITQTYI